MKLALLLALAPLALAQETFSGAAALDAQIEQAVRNGITPGAVNVHFEDHLEDGQLRFDYRMRDGVVRKSNALELMRAVGLEV